MPITRSRSSEFDAKVLAALDRLQRVYPELDEVDVAVAEVPTGARRDGNPDPIRLGAVVYRADGGGTTLTVYRRPIELRSAPGSQRDDLLADVMVELAAEILGVAPAKVDAEYGGGSARQRGERHG